jgi:16S rRNA (cytosine967-C5)-methyltransferase
MTSTLAPKNPPRRARLDARVAAAQVICALLREGASFNQSLPAVIESVTARDQGLVQALCFGVARYLHRYAQLAKRLMDKPLKAKDSDVLALLYIGFFQLDAMRIPDHAAIHSVVEASKALRKSWASGFLNALLRRYHREKSDWDDRFLQDAVFQSSHPQWLYNRLKAAWPQEHTAIMEANNSAPPLSLRVNTQTTDPDAWLTDWNRAPSSAEARKGRLCASAVIMDQAVELDTLPGFSTGGVSVQDEAAQWCAELLHLSPGLRVLDACAAPGGKTCLLLEREPQLASLLALDKDASRLGRLEQNLARLRKGLAITAAVEWRAADAATPDSWWSGEAFDRILLDAPCSATGVIRRHPDIKILRQDSDIAALAALQRQLLQALWPTLAPGGFLLYATCSILPDENVDTLAAFLANTPEAAPIEITPAAAATGWCRQAFGVQLFPEVGGHDGFYYCLLQKRLASPLITEQGPSRR